MLGRTSSNVCAHARIACCDAGLTVGGGASRPSCGRPELAPLVNAGLLRAVLSCDFGAPPSHGPEALGLRPRAYGFGLRLAPEASGLRITKEGEAEVGFW